MQALTIHDYWKLLAGLGLFLFGMFHLEEGVKNLEGRSFKLFLQNHTKRKISAILSGTIVTSVLQSSSLVNLIVLSFVGAGILSLRNALSVTLGANIGGTFNSWLVALMGFKIALDTYTFPLIAICGLGLVLFRTKKQVQLILTIGIGIAFIFLGMTYMKESMEYLLSNFDLTFYIDQPRIVFLFIGFVITALVQTSSATVVLALSALYTGLIPLTIAITLVIGAEFGTSIKLLLGSVGGIAAKKKLAWANIIFNFFTSLYGFILIEPILTLLTKVIGISDPIFLLVSFQTFLNISGVLLVYFFIDRFVDILEKNIKENTQTSTFYLNTTSPEITEIALQILEKEISIFIFRVIHFNSEILEITLSNRKENEFYALLSTRKRSDSEARTAKEYHQLKEAEGEILNYYSKISSKELQEGNRLHLNQLMTALRDAMYAAKGMKDIETDLIHFKNSSNNFKFEAYVKMQDFLKEFYGELSELLTEANQTEIFEKLSLAQIKIGKHFEKWTNFYILESHANKVKNVDLSTLININREVYSSSKALISGITVRMLNKESVENFESMTNLKQV